MISDKEILNKVLRSDGRISYSKIKVLGKEYLEYIHSRYSDSLSLEETLHRIKNNIEIRPVCPICGKPLEFKYREFRTYCSQQCKSKDKAITEKIQNTALQKYGAKFPMQSNDVKIKREQTCLQKYGAKSPLESDEIRRKIKKTDLKKYGTEYHISSVTVRNKSSNTLLQKYGDTIISHIPEIISKKQKTVIAKYNVSNVFQSEKVKLVLKQKQKQTTAKVWETKKKNRTTNTSKTEETCFDILSQKYIVYRQYKSDEYPFYCDFYIPKLNLYIELNYSWTHGNHPYENNIKDNAKVNEWNNKQSKYYSNAVNTWTKRDVIKLQTAVSNKLNYLCIYRKFDILQILKTIETEFIENTYDKQIVIGIS